MIEMSDDKVIRLLCKIRNSRFRGYDKHGLSEKLSPNKARRYLALLCLKNDPTSIRDVIEEANSSFEDSPNLKSDSICVNHSSGRRLASSEVVVHRLGSQ